MPECPELSALDRESTLAVRDHLVACASCRIVVELLEERRRGVAARDRRDECARFEVLLAARDEGTIGGSARELLDDHLRGCTDCQAVAATLPPADTHPAGSASLPAVSTASYAIGREVARGGMGRILAAEDLRIGRPVALKELLGKSSVSLAARFEREARVTARLQHPGIVPIYEIGKWPDGTPFYTMRFVEGRTLRDAIRDKSSLDERLALLPAVIAAADAVAFAHERRVIHRDLTPNNVLVGAHGDTVVIDWGLAKDLTGAGVDDSAAGPYRDEPAPEGLTHVGAVIGTAAYMPPEQAAGNSVDERADVYALGALLYHLLTSEAPYGASKSEDVLRQVRAAPPRSIRELAPRAPRDLVSIVEKAMSRAPAGRYADAGELAAELRRLQTGRLVEAHNYSTRERARRWLRAHRASALASAASLVVLIVVGSIGLVGVLQERDRAEAGERTALEQRAAADAAKTQAQHDTAALLEQQGQQELVAGHSERAAAMLSAAYTDGDDDLSLRFLLRSAMQNVEAVERTLRGGPQSVRQLAFNRDGSRLAVARGSLVEQWSVTDGVRLPPLSDGDVALGAVRYSTNGASLVTYGGDVVRVWEASTGRLLRRLSVPALVIAVIADDGSAVLSLQRDGVAKQWSVATGEMTREDQLGTVADGVPAEWMGFSRYLIADVKEGLAIWDWQRGGAPPWGGHGWRAARPFQIDTAKQRFLTWDATDLHIWDANGHVLRTLHDSEKLELCTFDTDRSHVLAVAIDGNATLWEVDTGVALARISVGGNGAVAALIGADRALTVGQFSQEVELRDAWTGTVLAAFQAVSVVIPEPGTGGRIAIAHEDGTVDLVHMDAGRLVGRFQRARHPGTVEQVRGDRALMREGTSATLWNVRTGDAIAGLGSPAALNDAGTRMVGMRDGEAIVLDARTGTQLAHVSLTTPVDELGVDAEGKRIMTWRVGQPAHVLRVPDGTGEAEFSIECCPTFSPDGGSVLEMAQMRGARLHGPPPGSAQMLSSKPFLAAYDPLGRRLAWIDVTNDDNDADHLRVLDLATSKRILDVTPASFGLSFDQSGELLATDTGAAIDVWSLAGHRKVVSIQPGHRSPAGIGVGINPDGTLLQGAAGVWLVADGRQLAQFAVARQSAHPTKGPKGEPEQGYEVGWVSFAPDGASVVNYTDHGDLVVWDMSVETRSAAEIARIVEQRVPWRIDNGRLVARVAVESDGGRHQPLEPAHVHGRVSFHGAPAPGAKVRAGDGRETIADSQGAFELADLVGDSVDLRANTDRAFTHARRFPLHPGDNEVTIDLDLAASITGRVVDGSGAPLAGVHVHAECIGCAADDSGDANTDENGAFDIGALAGGGHYALGVTNPPGHEVLVPVSPPLVDVNNCSDRAVVGAIVFTRVALVDDEISLAARPPAEEGRLRSPLNTAHEHLHLMNRSAHAVRVYWLDFAGRRRPYETITAGAAWESESYYGHVFLITDESDRGQMIFVVGPGPSRGLIQ
jgi:serine/threonine protein kinase